MDNDSLHRGALDKIEDVLLTHNSGDAETHISLGDLSDGMQERAFGLLLLLLALPCGLPFVYGLPQIVALPMLVLVFQMASGRRAPWLPEAMRKRMLPVTNLLSLVSITRHYAGWLEKLARPRFASITGDFGARIVGALLLIPCASILVPLPLTNTVPGIAVALAAVGLIERDGAFVIVGLIGGFIWVAALAIGGPTLVYFMIDWLLNR